MEEETFKIYNNSGKLIGIITTYTPLTLSMNVL